MDPTSDPSHARSSNHHIYFGICKEQIQRYEEAHSKLQTLEEEKSNSEYKSDQWWEYEKNIHELKTQRDRSGLVVIVFAAMCLEALIYDYGVRQISKSYFDNYLDDLRHVQKWVVVPKIITGESIDKDGQAFEKLSDLVTIRNNLIHNKSTELPIHDKEESTKWTQEQEEEFTDAVPNAMSAVFMMTAELRSIHPDAPFLGFYAPDHHSNEAFQKYT